MGFLVLSPEIQNLGSRKNVPNGNGVIHPMALLLLSIAHFQGDMHESHERRLENYARLVEKPESLLQLILQFLRCRVFLFFGF